LREVLLGKKGEALTPDVRRILSGHGLTLSDRSIVDISRCLGQLSRGREDILPLCAQLISNVAQIARELGWKQEL
jgi:hypothetical protein